jgi:DNA-binding transcriptional regulator YiaG
VRELADYLRVNESSVRKWLKREKLPLQPTIDAIHRWMVSQRPRKPSPKK